MQHQQVLVVESDGKLADALRPLAQTHGIWVRELRHSQACLGALKRAGAGLLVLKLGRDLEREFGLLQEVAWSFPDCRTLVVGDVDHPSLADLAWDLGAAFVVLPPAAHDMLVEIVAHILTRTVKNHD
jgi:DNA-binding NtrC family response regulator